jgi:alpha-ribazole phosphatase
MNSSEISGLGVVDLLRHGEVVGGQCFRGSTDDPLTDGGWQAMISAADSLVPWDMIITSPLMRCQQVAEILSKKHSAPLRIDPSFREICFGEWEGLTAEQIMQSDPLRLKQFWQNPEVYSPPGGEKTVDFQKRVLTAWSELVGSVNGSHQLLITHGGVIRAILADILGLSLAATFSLEVSWASITRIHLQTTKNPTRIIPQLAVMGGPL